MHEQFSILFICRAVGHKTYGDQYYEQMRDMIRKAAEQCDCLQSFFIIHSLGGGGCMEPITKMHLFISFSGICQCLESVHFYITV